MKRFFLFCCLMVSALFAVSQTKVTFTGVSLNGSYCPFDRVNVTNVTRGWTETLVYPDTVLILSGFGMEELSSDREGIIRVYPNPFEDFTNVEFSVLEFGLVNIRVVGVDGVLKTSWEGYMQSGTHQAKITLEKPQMAFVIVTTEKERYVSKLLHIGESGVNEIDACSASSVISGRSNGSDRSGERGDFMPGDMMSYEGVLMNCGSMVYSNMVTQAQFDDETISLVFPVTGLGGEVQCLPYYQSFTSEFGTYMTYDVLGPQLWEIDYATAEMSGYANNTNFANEDWLISSPVAVTGVSDAKMTMIYIGRYFNNINNEVTVWASTDYTWGDNPTDANWRQVPASLTENSNWTDFVTTEIALTDYVGQIVTFAVKYTSTDIKAGTIEIRSITIEEGTAGGGPNPPDPGGEVQYLPYCQTFEYDFGTYMTYDVMGPQSWTIEYNTACMSGYSGGSYYPNEDWLISSPVALTNVTDAKMTIRYIVRYFNMDENITIWASTNYGFGSDPMTATWIHLPVTLTPTNNWNDFQTAEISLSEFVGQTVSLAVRYTSSESEACTIEIQSICIEEGTAGGGPNPPGPGVEVQALPYTQSFASEFGTYMTYDEMGVQSWEIDYNTAKMTGYVGGNYYANIDWLISSPVAITNVSDAKMTMSYIGRYFNNINDEVTVWASTDYVWGDNPANATWTQVSSSLTEGNNWNDFLTTEIALTEYVGQTVTFAVRYTSTDSKAGTIEIQSITIEEGTAGGGPNPPGPGVEVQALPYTQSFASEFGTYMTYDEMGVQSWEIDYNTAKMTGYAGGNYYANIDWLISSPVAITDVNDAKMTMSYIGRYFNNINDEVTVWASNDYVWGDNPTNATWTQVSSSLTEGNNWNDFQTTEIALTEYVGQTVTFAVRYTSTDSKAGTIEIQSITIEEGTAGGGPTPPGPGMGSGTADDPYNVAAGINLQNESPVAWVQGYIVGAVKSGLSSVSSNDDINWNPPFDLVTNVLIADDVACHEISQCIIVNLPAGKPMRTAVNLVDHPENLGKRLSALGKLRRYFGQAGLRDCGGNENDFVLEGGNTPPTPPATIFSETFANGQGDFTIQDVVIPQELTYIWQHAPSYSCMKASAYVGQAFTAESWLVSPSIDLSGVSVAILNFEQAVNYASPQGALKVMISSNYNGDVTTAVWNELNIDQWPTGNNWTFITSIADLTNHVGQTVTVAFKYTSTTSASATWEVKNVLVE